MNIREIAKKANCSPATVSRVLGGREGTISISEATREKILAVCRENDYHPSIHAARLFSKCSRVVGFLYGGAANLYDENRSIALFYTAEALSGYGYRVLPLVNLAEFCRNEEFLNIFKRGEIDALIVWGASEESLPVFDRIRREGYPLLMQTNRLTDFPSVYAEQKAPVAELTRHCVSLGIARPAGIMSDDGFSYSMRRRGFLEAVGNLPVREFLFSHASVDDARMEEFCRAILESRSDAVICANDETAVRVECRLLRRGVRIPGDVLITGGDNIHLGQYSPVPVSTFDPASEYCARRGVERLIAHLERKEKLESEEVPSRVLLRESTSRPL